MKVIFWGTPEISLPSLDFLLKSDGIELCAVVTPPDRPSGRGNKLKSPETAIYAKENNIQLFQTANVNTDQDAIDKLTKINSDIFIVFAFSQFLSEKILMIPKLGCFNIHTSLLPKYRGAAPIQYAILNGDKNTGVSIQKMVKKMDAGDIAHSKEIAISENETSSTLHDKLKDLATLALEEFITKIKTTDIKYIVQDESLITFAPSIKKEDALLSFENEGTSAVDRKIRAYQPWPGAYLFLDNKKVQLFNVSKSSHIVEPGKITIIGKELVVGCKDGALSILDLKIEGKGKCSAQNLINGYKGELIITKEKK